MGGYLSPADHLLAFLQRSGSALCWYACPKSDPGLQRQVQLCHPAEVAGHEASPELCDASVASCSTPTKEVKRCLEGMICNLAFCRGVLGYWLHLPSAGRCRAEGTLYRLSTALQCSSHPPACQQQLIARVPCLFIQSPPLLVGKGQNFQW